MMVSRLVIFVMTAVTVSCVTGGRELRREANTIAGRAKVPAGGIRAVAVEQICQDLARKKLRYSFGSCRPENGGMDCSGTVQYVLSRAGYQNVPRQSNHQYLWVKQYGNLHDANALTPAVLGRLHPGDLLFWRGTYRTGKRWPDISHVMFYVGRDPRTGNHLMFGGRTSAMRGINGACIDYFPLRTGESEGRYGRFVGYGRPPGMR